MIHGDFLKIEQERMNIHIQEDETPNKYLKFKDGVQTLESLGVVLKFVYLKNISN